MKTLDITDFHAIELEARRLRAQAFADLLRGFGRLVLRAVAALRGSTRVRTA